MKELSIPLLTEQDIDCRVQSVSKAKTGRVGAVLLLYKVRFNMNGHTPAPQATQSATNGQNAQGGQSTNQQQRTAPQPQNSAQTGGAACPVCGGPISEAERRYSMNKFGREMCRACQKNA